jgi:hypothetical protein
LQTRLRTAATRLRRSRLAGTARQAERGEGPRRVPLDALALADPRPDSDPAVAAEWAELIELHARKASA